MQNYLDITLLISPGPDGTFRVRAASDDIGSVGNAILTLPFQLQDLAGAIFGASETARGYIAGRPDEAPSNPEGSPNTRNATDFGIELFEALFQDEIKTVLDQTEIIARTSPETGVRIRLSMDLREPGVDQVASLPWELICRRDQGPLGVSMRTPLVRSLDVAMSAEPEPFIAPLRILVLMANPSGTATLDLGEEKSLIEQSWARLPGVQVDFVRPVRAEVNERLRQAQYHVVHYMGHADYEADVGGMLLLQLEDGSPDPITGEEFAQWLANEPLRLVFLNACKTGTTSARSGAHPFAGVATALIRKNVPAVLAMQFPISDEAAIAFAETFYQSITGGLPVDAAVAEGRLALFSNERSEWATPVLYLRSRDGMLFPMINGDETSRAAAAGRDDGLPTDASENRQEIDDPWGDGPPGALRVFMATPDQDREKLHAQIARTLREAGVLVVDSVALDEKTHEQAVDSLVRRADLCVHLLGANPGPRVNCDDGDPLRTYPLEQLEIGRRAARSQLVVFTREDRQSIGNQEYADWVDKFAKLPRDKTRFELIITDKNRIITAVEAKLDDLKEARKVKVAPTSDETGSEVVRTAFVDSHVSDEERAIELLAFLEARSVNTDMRTSSSSDLADLKQLDETVRKSSLYIIVAGSVDRSWVSHRKVAIIKSAVKSRAPLLVASYTASPAESGEEGKVTGEHLNISALNDSDPSWVDRLFQPDGGDVA